MSAPVEFAEAGRLVLNVSPTAVRDLSLSNEAVAFNARFGGTPQAVYVPVAEVLAIYARENGQGMLLPMNTAAMTHRLAMAITPTQRPPGLDPACAWLSSLAHPAK